jgi:hypothetical protein
MVPACVAALGALAGGTLAGGRAVAQDRPQYETPQYTTQAPAALDPNYGLPTFGMPGLELPQRKPPEAKVEVDLSKSYSEFTFPKARTPGGSNMETPLYTTSEGSTTGDTTTLSDDMDTTGSDTLSTGKAARR